MLNVKLAVFSAAQHIDFCERSRSLTTVTGLIY